MHLQKGAVWAAVFFLLCRRVRSFLGHRGGGCQSNGLQPLAATSQTAEYLEKVRETMDESGFSESWTESVSLLAEKADLERQEAEDCLAQAWGWKRFAVVKSPMARKYIQTTEPNAALISEALDWLRGEPLSLEQPVLKSAIVKSPEVYLTDPASSYRKAIQCAPREYRDPTAFRELLVTEDPTLIMRTYNCADGGCDSQCGNCWVSRP